MNTKHFLTLLDFSPTELNGLIQRAIELKGEYKSGKIYEPLKNKVLGMVFEKSSTRTRVSFEAGMTQLGGGSIFLSPNDTQIGRGEPIEDTARVLSSMLDGIMIRTFSHELVERLAQYSSVPVINALTDDYHPCQLLADVQTFVEKRGSIQSANVVWIGDGNNMCHSFINAAKQFDFNLTISAPKGYEPKADILQKAHSQAKLIEDPYQACQDADLIVTDVWSSMGQESEQSERETAFANYQVNDDLMRVADKDALFMHCLPAHRGEEVTASVIDGKQSVVWDEAENRLHAQKALLECLMA